MTEYTINGRPATVEEVKSRLAYDEALEIRKELRALADGAAKYECKSISLIELDKEELRGAYVWLSNEAADAWRRYHTL